MPKQFLALGVLVLTSACHRAPEPPRLNVQRLCGKAVSAEVFRPPHDLWKQRALTVKIDQEVLLVFDPACRGVHVAPSPDKVLHLVPVIAGLTAEVRAPDGLVAGTYYRSTPGTLRFRLTARDQAPREVVVRFVP